MKYSREKSDLDKLYSRWVNSFQYTGFLNEKLLASRDRDFWNIMVEDIFTDCYTSSVYEGVLLAYKEIQYSELVMQNIILLTNKDADIYKMTDTYASLHPSMVKIYRCIFGLSPINSTSAKVGAQIKNTLNLFKRNKNGELIGEYAGWTPVNKVLDFFEKQLTLHSFDTEKLDSGDTLLADQPVTIVVPILNKAGYYDINGQDRRPLLGEAYYHNKTYLGQLKFIFKQKQRKKKSYVSRKYQAHFSTGIYTKNGYNKEIYYVKFFKEQLVNPFLVFEPDEVERLVNRVLSLDITEHTKEVLLNTYECYLLEIGLVRTKYKNKIPTIFKFIEKVDDSGFETKKQEMLEARRNSIEDYDEFSEDILDEEGDSIEGVNVTKQEKAFTVNRNIITLNLVLKLIMGLNGKTYYSFYSHLENELLKIADLSKSNFKGGTMVDTSLHPRGMALYATIASNSDIMITNDVSNPIDVFKLVTYKKKVFDVDTNPNTRGAKKSSVADYERYRYLDTNYGVIDSHTVKSVATSGIQGNTSLLQYWADRFIYRDDLKVDE